MRVLLVNSHGADLSAGGAERYVADLALGLQRRGHDPVVLSAFPTRHSPAAIETSAFHSTDWRDDEARRIRNHLRDAIAFADARLDLAVARARPDLVHTSNLAGFSTAAWEAARKARVPVVHTLHDYHLLCPRVTLVRRDGGPCVPHPLLCGVRIRRLARFAPAVSHVVAGSRHLLRRHAVFFSTAAMKVVRLPLVPVGTRPLVAPAQPPQTIGYLGRLSRAKGVGLLLQASARLRAAGLELHVAGDGPLRSAVEAAAADGRLRYAGVVQGAAKIAFIEGCDVGVVPSVWEEPSAPPYVVLEWLAGGRPVLASDRGGLHEAQALPGLTVFEPAAGNLVEGARQLRDPAAWRAILAALPDADDGDDVERWLDEHEEVYRAAIVGGRDETGAGNGSAGPP